MIQVISLELFGGLSVSLALIYISLSIVLCLTSVFEMLSNNKRVRSFLFVLVTFCLTILTGLRRWGGTDLANYQRYYENLESYEISYGILYEALNRFFIFLNFNFDQFLFFLAIIVIPSQAYFFYRFCRYPLTALFIFYVLNFIWLDHILIRQSIASIFILLAASLYISDKRISSVISVATATFFHASALIFSLISATMLLHIYIRTALAVFFIIVSITFFYTPYGWIESMPGISSNIPRYLTESEGVALSNFLEVLIVSLLFSKAKLYFSLREQKLFMAIMVTSVFALSLSYFIAPAARFLDYSKLFFVIIILRYLESRSAQFRRVFVLPIYLCGIAKVYYFCITFDGGVLFNANIN